MWQSVMTRFWSTGLKLINGTSPGQGMVARGGTEWPWTEGGEDMQWWLVQEGEEQCH
jgi:hypothetical protein